jgi:hypothetical protein
VLLLQSRECVSSHDLRDCILTVRLCCGDWRAAVGSSFSESFEDADLVKRGWYDGEKFRIAGNAHQGSGCIEYEWVRADQGVTGSNGSRRLFAPTDEVWLRFYLKLSKGMGVSGRSYHPHLLHSSPPRIRSGMVPRESLTLYCDAL